MKKIIMTAVAAVMATIGAAKADLPDYTMKFFVGGNAPLTWSFNNGLTLKHFSYNANTNVLSIDQNGIDYSHTFGSDEEWLPANDVRKINGQARALNNPLWTEGTYIGVTPVNVNGFTADFPVGVTLGANGTVTNKTVSQIPGITTETIGFYLTDGAISTAVTINVNYYQATGTYQFAVQVTGDESIAPAPGSYNAYNSDYDGTMEDIMDALAAAWAEYLGYK